MAKFLHFPLLYRFPRVRPQYKAQLLLAPCLSELFWPPDPEPRFSLNLSDPETTTTRGKYIFWSIDLDLNHLYGRI